MGRATATVMIDRPPDEVHEYLLDYRHQPEWQEGVTVEAVEPPGRTRVGTRITKTRKTPMGTQRFTDEITAVDDRTRSHSNRVLDGPFAGSGGTYRVSADGRGSRVDIVYDMRAVGIWRLMLPLIDRSARRVAPREMADLKRVLEQQPTAASEH